MSMGRDAMKAINSDAFREWVNGEVAEINLQIDEEGESDFLKAWRDTFETVWNKISEFEFDVAESVPKPVARKVSKGRKPVARNKVHRYLDKHPKAIDLSSREIAGICGVSKSSAIRALNDWRPAA